VATTVEELLKQLQSKGSPENIKGMNRFGMATDQRFGVPVPDMRKIAKRVGTDHALAVGLWKTGMQEARIVASVIDVPEEVTEDQMEAWVVEAYWRRFGAPTLSVFDRRLRLFAEFVEQLIIPFQVAVAAEQAQHI